MTGPIARGEERTRLQTVCGQSTKYATRQETSYVPVQRTATVTKTGTRTVDRLEVTTRGSGRGAVSIEGAQISGPVGPSGQANDSGSDRSGTADRALSYAADDTVRVVSALVAQAQEARARPLVAAGDQAVRERRFDEAEESYMLAFLETGKAAPGFQQYLSTNLGGVPDGALGGSSDWRVTEPPGPPAVQKDDRTERSSDSQRGGIDGFDVEYGGALAQSTDLGLQPNRAILGGYVHFRRMMLGSVLGDGWGLGIYDNVEVQGFVGGRTTTGFRRNDGSEEKAFGFGGGVAYRALVGYRASRAGVFVGVEPRVMFQELADVLQSGYFGPLMASVELRVAGPAVVTLTAWHSPTTDGTRSMGAELVLPLGRSSAGVRFAAERRYMHTELPVATNGDDTESIGIRETTFATAGLLLPF